MAEQTLDILHPSTTLEWDELPFLPVEMSDASSESVYLNGTLYVGGGPTVAKLCSLKLGVDTTWTMTDTPTYSYTLVVHDSELLLVGGEEYFTREETNKVFTMRDGQFVETLPPMNESRSSPSAVSSGSALVVAGGKNTSGFLSSVEVFKDGQWTTAPSLPSAGSNMKSALHGDQWYLITCFGIVFLASLQSLISGAVKFPWETLPDAPNMLTAAAFFGDHLLSIGGGVFYAPTTTIHAFSPNTQSWEHAADLPLSLTESSAVAVPTGELMIIGGKDKGGNSNKKVFRAFLRAPLVDSDVHFSIPKLNQLHKYGINLMDALSKDLYRFYTTSRVQLSVKDRKKALTLSARDYIEQIFSAWERSIRPTYPPTWESLFTVLRKMDLGHLTEQIAKCVTGSLPEIEDSEVQLSPGNKEQGWKSILTKLRDELKHLLLEYDTLKTELKNMTMEVCQLTDNYGNQIFLKENDSMHLILKNVSLHFLVQNLEGELDQLTEKCGNQADKIHQLNKSGEENSVTELRSEVKRRLLDYERLEEELDQLTDEYDKQADKIHQLEKENEKLRSNLRAKNQEVEVEPGYQDLKSLPHLPIEILSQPQESIHRFDLPGVDVVASTCVIVTNSPQTFHWVGYGFKLTIPRGSLPAGVDRCRLDIKASLAGQYQFPDNHRLVSGVFWILPLPLCQFQQQLTVEIQHSAKMTSSTKLSFVRAHCSQENLPYTFKQLEGRGSFTEHSSYGCLSVNHFSSYAIAAEGDVDVLYVASLYYLKADPRTVEIHFAININDEIHIAETRKYFEKLGAEEKLKFQVEFDNSTISLDIPLSSGVDINEWSLLPLVAPKISKSIVDSFKPGRTVPSTKLVATLSESSWHCKVPRRLHLVTLKGTKDPDYQIRIMLDPVDPNEGSLSVAPPQVLNPMGALAIPGQQSGNQHPWLATTSPSLQGYYAYNDQLYALQSQSVAHSTSGPLHPANASQPTTTLDELVNHIGINKDLLHQPCSTEHFTKIAPLVPNWQKYAIVLGLNQPQIVNIKSDHLLDPEMKAQQVLSLWKQANGFKATYSVLVGMCLQKKDVQLAESICNIVQEDLSRPPLITGEKREAPELTCIEQGSSEKKPCLINTASELD